MDPAALVEQHRDAIRRIAHKHGAVSIQVFGSVARGDSGPSSDLDLLVEMDPERNLLDRIAIQQDLQDLLGCNVDVVNRRAIHPLLRERVLSEAVAV